MPDVRVEHAAKLAMPDVRVEHAAKLAMPAVTPAEPHNPKLCGSSHAIRRQDWRRGTHDCALHLTPPPPVGQALVVEQAF